MLKCFSKLELHDLFPETDKEYQQQCRLAVAFSIFQYSHSYTATECSLCLLLKINAPSGTFVNSQNLIALQCLFIPIKTISSNLLDCSSNKSSIPAVRVIIQNCYIEPGNVSLQQSLNCGFCSCICFYCPSPLCMRKTEVNQYFCWFGFLNLTAAWPFLSLLDPFCSVRREFTYFLSMWR